MTTGLCRALLAKGTRSPLCSHFVERLYTIAQASYGTAQQLQCSLEVPSIARKLGASTTIIGILLVPLRNTIVGLYHLVFCMAKRGSPFAHIPDVDEAPPLAGGIVTPS